MEFVVLPLSHLMIIKKELVFLLLSLHHIPIECVNYWKKKNERERELLLYNLSKKKAGERAPFTDRWLSARKIEILQIPSIYIIPRWHFFALFHVTTVKSKRMLMFNVADYFFSINWLIDADTSKEYPLTLTFSLRSRGMFTYDIINLIEQTNQIYDFSLSLFCVSDKIDRHSIYFFLCVVSMDITMQCQQSCFI